MNKPIGNLLGAEKVTQENEEGIKMTKVELARYVSKYEQRNNIYMNFSVDNNEVWGLPEGDRTLHLLNNDNLNKYKNFLLKAIENYENLSSFYRDEFEYSKKLKKYKLYLKRLNNAFLKLKAER